MSSTNFIGFTETKNSSRVLKPPGGGHTDIFGIKEGNEIQTPSKRKNHPPSTINSCFMHEENTKLSKTKNEVDEKVDMKNGNQNGDKTDVVDENAEPKEINDDKEEKGNNEQETVAPPRRVRVPPGGFSSALW